MRPWQRCVNLLLPYLQQLALRPSLRALNVIRDGRGLSPLLFHFDLWQQSVFIADSAFGLEYTRPVPSTVQLVGPLQETETACDLSNHEGRRVRDLSDNAALEKWFKDEGDEVRPPSPPTPRAAPPPSQQTRPHPRQLSAELA